MSELTTRRVIEAGAWVPHSLANASGYDSPRERFQRTGAGGLADRAFHLKLD